MVEIDCDFEGEEVVLTITLPRQDIQQHVVPLIQRGALGRSEAKRYAYARVAQLAINALRGFEQEVMVDPQEAASKLEAQAQAIRARTPINVEGAEQILPALPEPQEAQPKRS